MLPDLSRKGEVHFLDDVIVWCQIYVLCIVCAIDCRAVLE